MCVHNIGTGLRQVAAERYLPYNLRHRASTARRERRSALAAHDSQRRPYGGYSLKTHGRTFEIIALCAGLLLTACAAPRTVERVTVIQVTATPAPQGATPAVAVVPETPTPEPTERPLPPELQRLLVIEDVQWLDRAFADWMERIADPRFMEMREAVERGDFAVMCQVRLSDAGSLSRQLFANQPPVEELRPAHEAAAAVVDGWQGLRKTLKTFCAAPDQAKVQPVLDGMEGILRAYRQLQDETERFPLPSLPVPNSELAAMSVGS